jgi:RNA polymerase sigma-70 factor (ECF subfamily)
MFFSSDYDASSPFACWELSSDSIDGDMAQAIDTIRLQSLLDRMHAGDAKAVDELIRGFQVRLEQLSRKMLRAYPKLRRWEDTGDIVQGAFLRLLRSLQNVRPSSTRGFLGLAGLQIQRELIHVARHYCGVRRLPRTASGEPGRFVPIFDADPAAPVEDAQDLERWAAFHEGVDHLHPDEIEIVHLIFYHGLPKAAAAELLGVTDRTVRRRWRAAMLKLHAIVNPA